MYEQVRLSTKWATLFVHVTTSTTAPNTSIILVTDRLTVTAVLHYFIFILPSLNLCTPVPPLVCMPQIGHVLAARNVRYNYKTRVRVFIPLINKSLCIYSINKSQCIYSINKSQCIYSINKSQCIYSINKN